MIKLPQKYRILQITDCEYGVREHLYALGLLPGKVVELCQVCPLGDPMIVKIVNRKWAVPKKVWQHLKLSREEFV